MNKSRLPILMAILIISMGLATTALATAGFMADSPSATCTVTTTADSGVGSLRECLTNANAGGTIDFNPAVFPPGSPVTISLTSGQLPDLTTGDVTIDASNAGVILDGSNFSGGEDGFGITSNGNVIKGMQILHFPGDGIEICCGAQENLIGGDSDEDRNIISGNGENGVRINGTDVISNTVSGNYIGVDATGLAARSNGDNGIGIYDNASNNLIGGDTPSERNIISGNFYHGVYIGDSGTSSNTVSGNYIGMDVTGDAGLGNGGHGVQLWLATHNNQILNNIISGNNNDGINTLNDGHHNLIQGNTIGLNATGDTAIGNSGSGISLDEGGWDGKAPRENLILENVISGNGGNGIHIGHHTTMSNTISGNYIGTDISGTTAIPNGGNGINIGSGANNNLIGGENTHQRSLTAGNLISGNNENGIRIDGVGQIIGDAPLIDDVTISFDGGPNELHNGDFSGDFVHWGTWDDYPSASRTINSSEYVSSPNSYQFDRGDGLGAIRSFYDTLTQTVVFTDPYAVDSSIWITATPGDELEFSFWYSGSLGLAVALGLQDNGDSFHLINWYPDWVNTWTYRSYTITLPGDIVAVGIQFDVYSEAQTKDNIISGNYIGTDASGTSPLPNFNNGVEITNHAINTLVGGATSGEGNLIAFNSNNGIYVNGSGTWYNTISHNSVYSNADRGIVLSDDGNMDLDAPTITGVDLPGGIVTGTACANCTVEIFSTDDEEGRIFEGTTTAYPTGDWSLVTGSSFTGPNLTATATDGDGNTSAFSSLPATVLAYWSFEGNLFDYSGDFDLFQEGDSLYYSQGCAGQALHFGYDSSSYLTRGVDDNDFDFGVQDYSLEMWVNFDRVPNRSNEQTLIEKCDGGGCTENGWSLTILGDNSIRYVQNDGEHNTIDSGYIPFQVGQWVHLVIVRRGSSATIYVDGDEVASGDAFTLLDSDNPLIIGRRFDEGQQFPFSGFLDEVTIYQGALTYEEVQANYQNGAVCQDLPYPMQIFIYDDYEEDNYSNSLREYLEARGHKVTYQHDDVGDIDVWNEYGDYDAVLAIHTTGGGTLTNLETWFLNGRGYVAMLGDNMWGDEQDDYIKNLLGVGDSGDAGEGWSYDQLSWADPTHPISYTPNAGWEITLLPQGQYSYYVDIIGGHTVITATGSAVLQTREGVEGAARLAVYGSNYHDVDRTAPEARYLVENMLSWVADVRPAAWFNVDRLEQKGALGSTVTYQFELLNRTGQAATFDLSVSGNTWVTTISEQSFGRLSVGPLDDGERALINVDVDIPPGAGPDDQDYATITAVAQHDPNLVATAETYTYAPGPPYYLNFYADQHDIAAFGTTGLTTDVYDRDWFSVADGTEVELALFGSGGLDPISGTTTGGVFTSTFQGGSDCELPYLEASAGGSWDRIYVSVGTSGPTNIPGGEIGTDTTWAACDGPYIIQGDVTISNTAALTVEAGAQVRFDYGTGLYVLGALQVPGESDAHVLFTLNDDNPDRGNWMGLVFGNADNAAGGTLDYAAVSYAGQDFDWEGMGVNAGVFVFRGEPQVQNSLFYHNIGNSLFAARNSLPSIEDSTFFDNDTGIAMLSANMEVADTPIPSGLNEDVDWRYLAFDTPDSGWQTDIGFDDSTWDSGQSPIGDSWDNNTYLDLDGEKLYLRKVFTPTLPPGMDYYVRANRDDQVTIWINGSMVYTEAGGGGAQWTEYLSVTSYLNAGANLMAVENRDPGHGANFFDLELVAGTFQHATITGNRVWRNGRNGWSGLFIGRSSPLVLENRIYENQNRGIVSSGDGFPLIANNLIYNNDGSGMVISDSWPGGRPAIINNTIDGNGGQGIEWRNGHQDEPSIRNNIVTRNDGGGISCWHTHILDVAYNDSWGNGNWDYDCQAWDFEDQPGNISSDPIFLDPESPDYHLQLGSPAIDAGDPDPSFNDVNDSRNDMGAYGGPGGETYAYEDVSGPIVENATADPGTVTPGGDVIVSASIWDVSGVAWAEAEIESPDETLVVTMTLYDDGAHNDGGAGDDIYANSWTTPVGEVNYLVDILAEDGLAQGSLYDNATSFWVRTPVTLVVTTTADSGFGSLRWALGNALPGDKVIFDTTVFPPGTPQTITLTSSQLPELDVGYVTIDATNAGVILDGSGLSGGESGLHISSSANVIQGLQILYFPNNGIEICCGAQDNLIGGTTAAERNVISGNGGDGINLHDSEVMNNVVSGNYIGLDSSGTNPLPNRYDGVFINDGPSYNLIGGGNTSRRAPTAGNMIIATGSGVVLRELGTMSNTVQGNYIGIDLDGAAQAFPMDAAISPNYVNDCTLYVATRTSGVHKSTDCGDSWSEFNNGMLESRINQVVIPPDASDDDTVYALTDQGYLYGTTDGGLNWNLVSTVLESIDRRNLVLSADFSNDDTMYASAEHWSWWGLWAGPGVFKSTNGGVDWERMVDGMSDDHVWKVVASPDPAEKDTLFALTHSGIEKSTDGGENWLTVPDPDCCVSGLALSPNYASDQTVFVTTESGWLYFSDDGGDSWTGVEAMRDDPRYPTFSPDFGVDQTVCHGGGWNDSIYCSTNGGANWYQRETMLPGHLDNDTTGILFSPDFVSQPDVFMLSVAGMSRSTDSGENWELLRSLRDIGGRHGVEISNGASYNIIGPDNVIANNHSGVELYGESNHNTITGNLIGTDPTGTYAVANSGDGIAMGDAHHNRIIDNLVSGNISFGIGMWNTETYSNTIQDNFIGTDITGEYPVGNGDDGVHMNRANHNYVLDNLISGNGTGVSMCCSEETSYNVIRGNKIGTNVDGTSALPNNGNGVRLDGGSSHNEIGGPSPGDGNLISGNYRQGVELNGYETSYNLIRGNIVGTDVSGSYAIPNGGEGISIRNGASYNQVGGDMDTEGNLISGNQYQGISIGNEETMSNTVQGNIIGLDASGSFAIPNWGSGIELHNRTSHNLIGSDQPGYGNLISGNGVDCEWCDGVSLSDEAHDNTVQGNYIGTDISGTEAVGNSSDGVDVHDGSYDNLVIKNLISGNEHNGVSVQQWAYHNVVRDNLIGTDASGTRPLPNQPVETLRSGQSEAVFTGLNSSRCTPLENYPEEVQSLFAEEDSFECIADGLPATLTSPEETNAPQSNNWYGVLLGEGAQENVIGPGNTIAFNMRNGIRVTDGDTISNTITQNSIYYNSWAGIATGWGGNRELDAPNITGVNLATGVVSGTACINCTVEVFSSDTESGRNYEGSVVADGDGEFEYLHGSPLAGPYIVATATDQGGNTSVFSALFDLLWVDLGLEHTAELMDIINMPFDRVDVGNFNSVTLSDYDVIFVGSTSEWVPDDIFQPLVDRRDDIRDFVQAGGGLVALSNGGDWSNNTTSLDWAWVPISLTVSPEIRRTHIVNPTHDLVEWMTDNTFFYWWGSHGEAFDDWDWPEATNVVQASVEGRSGLLVGPYGAGRMALTGMFPDYDLSTGGRILVSNMIRWAGGILADDPPRVSRAYPEPNGWAASESRLRIWFDQLVDPATITPDVLTVIADSGPVTGTMDFYSDLSMFFFTPDDPLPAGEMVTATLSDVFTDLSGYALDGNGDFVSGGDYFWNFTVNVGHTFVVTSTDNDGYGTLRWALEDAKPGDTITFDTGVFPPGSPATIALDWELPWLWQGYLTIDASDAGVVIDDQYNSWAGLDIGSDGNVIQGLTIINAGDVGIHISAGSAYNLIGGDRTVGAGPNGQGNTIGYSGWNGIFVQHGPIHNTFLGNYVGVDPTGTQAWPNGFGNGHGIFIELGSDYTTIGGNAPGERNVLSGNEGFGLNVQESYSLTLVNNYLGTDASGSNPIPNRWLGLWLVAASRYAHIEGNVFSGNGMSGINSYGIGTGENTFTNNIMGLDASGTIPLPNDTNGIVIGYGSDNVVIENNVIAGNNNNGVAIWAGSKNIVRGNAIGTDATGMLDLGNGLNGVYVFDSDYLNADAVNNLIVENIIAHNQFGVNISEENGWLVLSNTVTMNSIYDNQDEGIALFGTANNNILPPIVTSFERAPGDVSGTACADCTIEIFSDDDDEGRWYEGTTLADGSGNWSFTKGAPFTGTLVHATATDATGSTSEFSGPAPVVLSLYPTSTVTNTVNLGVLITGTNFQDNQPLDVDFGAGIYVADVYFLDHEHLKAYLDVAPEAPLGLRDVIVNNYDGQSGTLVDGFEIVPLPPPPPSVTHVSASEVATDTQGVLHVYGKRFIELPDVVFSGEGVNVDWVAFEDPTHLWIGVTVNPTASLGTRAITVTNPDGQWSVLPDALTVVAPYFTDVAPNLGLDFSTGEAGASWGDLDGDGWLDLALGDGSLFTSTLGTTFDDATGAAGLDYVGRYGGLAWGDYDNDGNIDLLSTRSKVYRQESLPFNKVWDDDGDRPSFAWVDYDLDGDLDIFASGRLYRYDGSDTFTDVTSSSGIGDENWALTSVWADYDDDGYPDLFLTGDCCDNMLYRNNGDGTFVDMSSAAGVDDGGSGHGAVWGDFDNDGDFDLFVANNDGQYNVLYSNNGNGTFQDVSEAAGLLNTSPGYGTGANALDYNLDGWLDIFVVNREDENRLLRNNGDGTFTDYRMASGAADDRDSDGSTVGDYDNDGDADIYVVSGIFDENTPNFLYRNNTDPGLEGPHWLKVKLVGVLSNHSAIGAVVRLFADGPVQMRQFAGSSGYMSQDALEALFGVGSYSETVTVEVTWPSGVVDTIPDVPVDQTLTIIESTPFIHNIAMVNVLPDGEWPIEIDLTPVATVRNLGIGVETVVPVTCTIDYEGNQVYSQTIATGAVDPSYWDKLIFPDFSPQDTGLYTITCQSYLPGDEWLADDWMTSTISVTQQIVDIWTKDNERDNGDEPSGLNDWYGSPDLWVRNLEDGGLFHQDPIANITNTVYVRLRNRGNAPAITGTVSVYWIEPSLGVRCGDWALIDVITFTNLLPGEQRIVTTPWTPTRTGHTCMQDVVDSPQDPYNRGLECSPQWVPWDNNVEWHNINIIANPSRGRGVMDIQDAEVQLVNIYNLPQDVDMIIDRLTFPLTGTVTVRLPEGLFDRWMAYGGSWGDGIELLTDTKEILITGEVSATIGSIPMFADENVTVGLHFVGPAGLEFEIAVRERIGGITTGGVGYQWTIPDTTPPQVVGTSPVNTEEDVPLGVPIVITFTEEIGPLSFDFTLTPDPGGLGYTWNAAGTVVTVTHNEFNEKRTYTAETTANDAAGNAMVSPFNWSFRTVDLTAPTPPDLVSPENGALINDTTPTLTWLPSPSADVAGYLLDFNGAVMDVGEDTEYTTTILADDIYTWTLAAYDGVGNTSAFTYTWRFTVDATPPTPPDLVSPMDTALISDTTPTLTWSPSPSIDVVGYLLNFNDALTDVGEDTEYTTAILPDDIYTWTLAAYDGLGNTSAYTDFWSFTVDATPPTPPDLVSPMDTALISDTTPTLTWSPSPSMDVAGYLLNFNGAVTDVGEDTEYTTTILSDDNYTWTLAAYDGLGNTSAFTYTWRFTVDATSPTPPDLVSPMDTALISVTTPTLTWSPSPSIDVAGYLLNFNGVVTDVGEDTEYTTEILPDDIYTWTLAAYDGLGNSSVFTDTWNFTVDATPPTPPDLVSPMDTALISDTTPTLTWAPSPSLDVVGYLLDFNGVVLDMEDELQYTSGILTDGTYTWTLAAYDDLGNTSVYTDVWSFTLDATPPDVVAVSPLSGTLDVELNAPITIIFSEEVYTTSLILNLIPEVSGPYTTTWNEIGTTVIITHTGFTETTMYTAGVTVVDLAVNALMEPYIWSFATLTEEYLIYLPIITFNLR